MATVVIDKGKEHPISELAEEAMEAGFEADVEIPYVCDFEEGDKVVYPHHGAGLVLKKESRELMGEERDYLTIKILHNELTVMVPCENAGVAGLRRVIDEEEIKKVTDVLTDDVSDMPKNWNRRFKYNREKIKTGDVFELAEVVRNLAIREMEKGLSTGEKQMYTRAKKILASEFMYALDKDEEGAEEYLDGLLEELRAEARSRRPEGLRVGGRPAAGRVVDRRFPGGALGALDRGGLSARSRSRPGRRRPGCRRRRRHPRRVGLQRPGRGRDRAGRDPRCGAAVGHPRADRGGRRDARRRPRGVGSDRRHPRHRHDQAGRSGTSHGP
jgi:CarD family transcriptional regulator